VIEIVPLAEEVGFEPTVPETGTPVFGPVYLTLSTRNNKEVPSVPFALTSLINR
jgi:hypothetical protein